MARIFVCGALAVAVLCAGCATAPSNAENTAKQQNTEKKTASVKAQPEPEWVAGEIKQYPRLQYITARAQGDSAASAAEQAKAHIAALFLVDITQYDMTLQQAQVAAAYEMNNSYVGNAAQHVATAEVGRVLDKIELVGEWHDTGNNRYHALAALPRNTGLGYLTDEIRKLDEKTQAYMKEARSNIDPFSQAGMIAKAWRCQQLRSKLQDSMRTADLTARGIAPQWDLNLLRQDALNLVGTLQIEPAVQSGEDNAEQMRAMIKAGMKVAGLNPAESHADYVMRGSLEAAVIGEQNGWALGRGQLKLELADKVTGAIRGNKSWQVEVPGLDEDAAIRRVYEKTEYMLKVQMRDILMEMAMQ